MKVKNENEKKKNESNQDFKNGCLGCLTIIIIILIIASFLFSTLKDDSEKSEKESTKQEETQEETQETNAYGWTTDDYLDFSVALKTIAGNYLSNYKLPSYDKWQFAKFDDYRIIAMTDELTFKDSHDKHTAICVFVVTEGGTVAWSYFATDEKVYFDDGSCDEVFENIKSLSQ